MYIDNELLTKLGYRSTTLISNGFFHTIKHKNEKLIKLSPEIPKDRMRVSYNGVYLDAGYNYDIDGDNLILKFDTYEGALISIPPVVEFNFEPIENIELALLKKLFNVANRLDLAYCTLLNSGDCVVKADEYEKLMDDLDQVEEYLKTK